jgi:hypothetical protein
MFQKSDPISVQKLPWVNHIIIHPYAIDILPSPLEGGLCNGSTIGHPFPRPFQLELVKLMDLWGFIYLG